MEKSGHVGYELVSNHGCHCKHTEKNQLKVDCFKTKHNKFLFDLFGCFIKKSSLSPKTDEINYVFLLKVPLPRGQGLKRLVETHCFSCACVDDFAIVCDEDALDDFVVEVKCHIAVLCKEVEKVENVVCKHPS